MLQNLSEGYIHINAEILLQVVSMETGIQLVMQPIVMNMMTTLGMFFVAQRALRNHKRSESNPLCKLP